MKCNPSTLNPESFGGLLPLLITGYMLSLDSAHAADALQKLSTSDVVQPILQQRCLSCHNAEKHKGGLRMDSLDALLKGGESGPILVAGKAKESPMIKRLLLPPDHEDHMPPKEKPQPTQDELAVLQWWIDAGAPADKKAADLNPPENIVRILGAVAGAPKAIAPAGRLDEVLPLANRLADDLGVLITPLAQNEPWLQCNASLAGKNFGDGELARLAPLKAHLRWLDLAGTQVTDAGLAHLVGMKNLTRLHLERTTVTDAGLTNLIGLGELEYLNLYGTSVNNEGLAHLKPLKNLRRLYLWQTKVTPEAAEALGADLTDKEQVRRWRQEIDVLRAKIRSASVEVDLGTLLAATKEPDRKPINAKCPVSGKDIDPAKAVAYEGKLVAFCCDNCKGQFEKDPKPFLTKLNLAPATAESKAGK